MAQSPGQQEAAQKLSGLTPVRVTPVLQRYRQRKVQEQQEAAQQLSGRVEQAVDGLGGWVSMGELCEEGALEAALGG